MGEWRYNFTNCNASTRCRLEVSITPWSYYPLGSDGNQPPDSLVIQILD
jgi:hypothetical protein